MFLVKCSRLDIANVTRELSKVNYVENTETYKELLCIIRYILNTKNYGLKLEPTNNANNPWEIVCL